MTRCPDCRGAGESLAHVNAGASSGFRLLPCTLCAGTGQITRETLRWHQLGKRCRKERVEVRKQTLRAAARELRMDAVTLSKCEQGRIDPTELARRLEIVAPQAEGSKT